MKTIREMIEVMQAYERGEKIQCYEKPGWFDVHLPHWDWMNRDYRIKPAPKRQERGEMRLVQISQHVWIQSGGWEYEALADIRVREVIEE